jgi:hypothetical protein
MDRFRQIACGTDFTKTLHFGRGYYLSLFEKVKDWKWLEMRPHEKQIEQILHGEEDDK